MKEKLLHLKEKIMENKIASTIIAACVVAVIVIAIVAGMSLSGGKKESAGSSATGSSGNLAKNESSESDDKNSTDNKDNNSSNEQKDETGENESETTTGNESGEQGTAGENGNSGSSNNNSSGNGNSGGSGNGSSGNGGSSTGNSGNGSGNTGNTGNSNTGNTGNTGNSNTGNSNTGNGNTGNSNTGNSNTGTGTGTSSGTTGADTPQANQETIYNQLFDINSMVTIKLEISDAELQKLQADYSKYGEGKSPIYRKVDKMTVTINGQSYELYEVGVRMKGNTSRCSVYNNGDVNNRNLIHLRLSFDETFDDTTYYGTDAKKWSSDAARAERKKRTFATLNGLELKWNRNLDGTYVANLYANEMFRALGVYAQKTGLANLNFGGYNYGVYSIYEPIDGNFLERYFPSYTSGDLYKCGWSNIGASYTNGSTSSIGIKTPYKAYAYDLKTNKSTSTHASLKNLISKLNSSPSKSTFASVVDTNNWVMFAAASYFAGNPDDLRNNYNNHYLYFMNGKAIFIPYDYDRCFGITTSGQDMTTYSPYADNTALQGGQGNPLYLYSITGRANNYTSEYTAALKQVANSGWINYSKYLSYYNAAKNHYSSVAIPDSNVHVYIKEFGSNTGKTYNNSVLAFSESNSYNTSVSSYMTKIMQSYNTAMSKWN